MYISKYLIGQRLKFMSDRQTPPYSTQLQQRRKKALVVTPRRARTAAARGAGPCSLSTHAAPLSTCLTK